MRMYVGEVFKLHHQVVAAMEVLHHGPRVYGPICVAKEETWIDGHKQLVDYCDDEDYWVHALEGEMCPR
jgi:hypothetical protein